MKKLFCFVILIYFLHTNILFGQGALIISQYYEGASNDKWLEVTNVGNATLDLTSPQLYLHLFSNAAAIDPANSTPNNSYTLTGNLSVGQVIIFQHASAVNPTYASGTPITVCNFNGNDLVIISTSGNTTDNGVAWTNRLDVVGDGSDWGTNTSFSRNTPTINPSTTFTISDWTEFTNAQVDAAVTGTNERLDEFTGYVPLPVEMSSFSAIVLDDAIKLNWRTETEVSNYGFEIERSEVNPKSEIGNPQFSKIGFVEGNGNSNSPKNYSFINEIVNAGRYSYRLKQVDTDGQFEYSKIIEIHFGSPAKFELSQNYPNPFNPSTTISFTLPQSGDVTLKVYNTIGEQVAELVNGFKEAGIHTIDFDGSQLTSGCYIYKLEANGLANSKKMLLVK